MAVKRSRATRVAWMAGPTPDVAPPRTGLGWPSDAPAETHAAPPAESAASAEPTAAAPQAAPVQVQTVSSLGPPPPPPPQAELATALSPSAPLAEVLAAAAAPSPEPRADVLPAAAVRSPEPHVQAFAAAAVAQPARPVPLSATLPQPSAEPEADEPAPGSHRPFEEALRPGDVDRAPGTSGPRIVRVALVEDVAEVTHHIRELLRTQARFRLVHVSDDGRKALEQLEDVNPDVVIVDSLLQGRTSSKDVVKALRERGREVGLVAISVPDHPLDKSVEANVDAVVAMPFGQVELARGISDAFTALMARDPSSTSRIVTVYSPKGGVGTTTIAYNLAVAIAETGLRTVLVDGGLQFAGLRRLLLADGEAPSIMDLPTFELREADVADTVVQLVGGVDALLAPPRPEMSDLIARRDVDQMLEVLRRTYQAIVIDTSPSLGDATLAFLDSADLVLGVVTPEPAAADAMRVMADTFVAMGFRDEKVQLVVNDRDRPGAVSPRELTAMVGREPSFSVASDAATVAQSNGRGAPFVLARPDAAVSRDIRGMAASIRAAVVTTAPGVHLPRVSWRH